MVRALLTASIDGKNDMDALFRPTTDVPELLLRAALVYFALLVLLRLSGKRTVGQFTPFDLIVLMLVSEAAQNALIAGDESVTGALVVIAMLVALNWLVGFASARSKTIDALVEGRPVLIARDGAIFEDELRRRNVSVPEFRQAMRREGVPRDEEIRFAFLETNGDITIVSREEAARS